MFVEGITLSTVYATHLMPVAHEAQELCHSAIFLVCFDKLSCDHGTHFNLERNWASPVATCLLACLPHKAAFFY